MVLFFKILAKKNDYIVQYPKSQVPALSLTCDFGYRWMPNSNQNHTIPNVAIFSKSGNWPILSNQNLNGATRERDDLGLNFQEVLSLKAGFGIINISDLS